MELPPMFEWLKDAGSVANPEMLRTFNCGIGMVLVCEASQAGTVEAALRLGGEETVIRLGELTKRGQGEAVLVQTWWPEQMVDA